MTYSKDKGGGKRKDKKGSKASLSGKDAALWKIMTKDVRRLPGRNYEPGDDVEKDESENHSVGIIQDQVLHAKNKSVKLGVPAGRDVDSRTAKRLSRGQMDIEATIDLHGFGQSEAREALRRFIIASQKRGRRCVLVITGKGQPGKPGILKMRVPEWLEELGPLVLKTAPAKANHGGQGALYVLLRRNR